MTGESAPRRLRAIWTGWRTAADARAAGFASLFSVRIFVGALVNMIPTSAVDRQLLAKLLSVQYTVFRGKCRKPVPEIGKTTYVHKNVPEYPHPEFEDNEFLPRRLSYWPPDLPQLQKPNPRKPWWKVKEMITLYPPPPEEPEYTESPNYPPISNFFRVNSRPLQERAKRLEWYDKIKALPTPDQKMYEIVEVRDHACVLMQAWSHLYDNLPLYQHLTKTNLIRGSLPSSYDNMDVSSVKEELKHHILDTVRMHAIDAKRKRPGRIQRPDIVPKEMRPDHLPVENLIEEITAICMKSLGNEHPHLLDAQVNAKCSVFGIFICMLSGRLLAGYSVLVDCGRLANAKQSSEI